MSGDGSIAISAATPLDNDDILAEILLRLPPRPSSLPRASLVGKRWRRLVSDPCFLRRFRARHWKPPLLGLMFNDVVGNIRFTPSLDSPDCIPAARFSLRRDNAMFHRMLDCRHGRVLVLDRDKRSFMVWEPVTGDQHHVSFPPEFDKLRLHVEHGAVVCAAGDQGHVHGACHSGPFRVVLIGNGLKGLFACVYSSETDKWDGCTSIICPPNISCFSYRYSSTLVGNSLCWVLVGRSVAILEFDLDRQSLAIIEAPPDALDIRLQYGGLCRFLITAGDDGGLGFLILLGFSILVWKRTASCHDVDGWVLRGTVELDNLLSLRPGVTTRPVEMPTEIPIEILGLAEDDNVMFVLTNAGVVFMVHLETLQFKRLPETMMYSYCHPLTSFYPAGQCLDFCSGSTGA
ncbi:hypothetical protein ACP70R_019785 [Stipagrostis hirtigluma subsp. patula]